MAHLGPHIESEQASQTVSRRRTVRTRGRMKACRPGILLLLGSRMRA